MAESFIVKPLVSPSISPPKITTQAFTALSSTSSSTSLLAEAPPAAAEVSFTVPKVWNKPAFRFVALVTPLSILTYTTSNIPALPLSILHLLAWGANFGTNAYTTFIGGITTFKNLPRRQFAKLQAKLFPKYFALTTATAILQLATLKALTGLTPIATIVTLISSLVNLLYLEPESSSIMRSRHVLEDDGKQDSEEYKKLKASFGKLHGMSSLANLVALVGLMIHGVGIAKKIVVA